MALKAYQQVIHLILLTFITYFHFQTQKSQKLGDNYKLIKPKQYSLTNSYSMAIEYQGTIYYGVYNWGHILTLAKYFSLFLVSKHTRQEFWLI